MEIFQRIRRVFARKDKFKTESDTDTVKLSCKNETYTDNSLCCLHQISADVHAVQVRNEDNANQTCLKDTPCDSELCFSGRIYHEHFKHLWHKISHLNLVDDNVRPFLLNYCCPEQELPFRCDKRSLECVPERCSSYKNAVDSQSASLDAPQSLLAIAYPNSGVGISVTDSFSYEENEMHSIFTDKSISMQKDDIYEDEQGYETVEPEANTQSLKGEDVLGTLDIFSRCNSLNNSLLEEIITDWTASVSLQLSESSEFASFANASYIDIHDDSKKYANSDEDNKLVQIQEEVDSKQNGNNEDMPQEIKSAVCDVEEYFPSQKARLNTTLSELLAHFFKTHKRPILSKTGRYLVAEIQETYKKLPESVKTVIAYPVARQGNQTGQNTNEQETGSAASSTHAAESSSDETGSNQQDFRAQLEGLSLYFHEMQQEPMPTLLESVRHEWIRLRTFCSFPLNIGVFPIKLAKWGFYYTGHCGETKCFSCARTYNWEDGDDPLSVHRRISPSCPFLLGTDIRNEPITRPSLPSVIPGGQLAGLLQSQDPSSTESSTAVMSVTQEQVIANVPPTPGSNSDNSNFASVGTSSLVENRILITASTNQEKNIDVTSTLQAGKNATETSVSTDSTPNVVSTSTSETITTDAPRTSPGTVTSTGFMSASSMPGATAAPESSDISSAVKNIKEMGYTDEIIQRAVGIFFIKQPQAPQKLTATALIHIILDEMGTSSEGETDPSL